MAGPALDRVLQRLHGVKSIAAGQGNLSGYKAYCPIHDDKVQSLQVTERPDYSVGLHCHAGCHKVPILDALGLQFADLFVPEQSSKNKQVVAEYDYRDLDGNLLYQAVRYFPKSFSQRRPDGKGGWVNDMVPLKGKHVPYRLNELKGHNDVTVVEGEKDADRLWSIGIPATTNIGGAKKWSASETKALKAAGVTRVFIIPDNDEAGIAHAELVGQSAKQAQLAVSLLNLPGMGSHGDVSDWLYNGGSKEALLALMSAQLYVVPPQHVPTPVALPAPLPDALPNPTGYTIGATVGAGAAESFRDRFKDRLRYDHARKQWHVWDQHRWKRDENEEVMRLALEHSRRWGQEVIGAAPDFTERKRWQDYTLKLERRPDRVTMLADAQALPPFSNTPVWDADPWLLGVTNGVVDLRTGQLQNGQPADWISQQAGAVYDPSAECPRWMQFLKEVFEDDAELIAYVQKAVGYSMTGDMREQCFFLAVGGGSNGKSIFLNTLEALLGDYSKRASMRLFIGDASEFHMAELQGARLVLAAESKPDTRLNTDIIKSLTGGETQQAERKHQNPFKFRPVGKIWLGVNHVPKVLDDSKGFWRRVRLVPFDVTFDGKTDDKQLRDKVAAELPGILAWAVAGAKAWFEEGLVSPAKVAAATEDYQTAEDPLVEFISERCLIGSTVGTSTFAAIQSAYHAWCDDQKVNRDDRMTRRGLGTHLKRRFKEDPSTPHRAYIGIKVKTEEKAAPGELNYGTPDDPDGF